MAFYGLSQPMPGRLALPEDAALEYITDVEGNWEYFNALVARSKILTWCPTDASLLRLADSGHLVFGGDAPDKGPGDIRITRALVLLQRAHPDRVFLLAGNRDVNKLRFAAELADGEMPDQDPIPYIDNHGWEGKKQQYAPFLEERGLERTQRSALQWLLEKTFGARTALQTRREELELLGCPCDDAAVFHSFRELVDPDAAHPWQLWYLRAAHVMILIGDCLFVHGAVRSRGLLLVPADECRDGEMETQPPGVRLPASTPIEDWVAEVNAWKARQLRAFEAFPRFRRPQGRRGEERWRGGAPLMMPSLVGCHVMTDGYLKGGNLAPLDDDVAAYLAANGVRRVFTGHQPQGQSPGVLRCPGAGITVLAADTTFSDPASDKSRNPADMRGRAVSTVTVRCNSTTVQGILADGTAHGFVLNTDWTRDGEAAALVGRRLSDDSWGKTVVDGKLQTCRGEGFSLHLAVVDPPDARARLHPDFGLAP